MSAGREISVLDFIASAAVSLNERNLPEEFCRWLQQKFPEIPFAVLEHDYSPWPYRIITPGVFAQQGLEILNSLRPQDYNTRSMPSSCKIKNLVLFPFAGQRQQVNHLLLAGAVDPARTALISGLVEQARTLFQCLNNTARQAAAAAHKQCAAYISNITHDFNSMIALISILNVENDSVQQKLVYGKKLTRDFLFYLSELELSRIPLPVHDMLTAILLNFSSPIEITTTSPPAEPPDEQMSLLVDLELINRAMLAVLENSVYYAGLLHLPEAGRVQIAFSRIKNNSIFIRHDWLKLTISNTGPAIPAEFLDKVKDPLFTTLKDQGRVGMGLAIAEKIIQAHNGCLSVANAGSGGVHVTICLPLEESHGKK